MESVIKFINETPEFFWNNLTTIITTLICGLIVAYFTSTFLKKKEERTRIAGIIVEKRLDSEQKIQNYLEKGLYKEEININNSNKDDHLFTETLKSFNLPTSYENTVQYAKVFKEFESFKKFFDSFDDLLLSNKLWLDSKVKNQLIYMQVYFSFFNTIPLMVKRIPLPKGNELTNDEFSNVCDKVLFFLGIAFDFEINSLLSDLDEKIVDSIYKLELDRPKKSVIRDNMYNSDMKKILRRLENETELFNHGRNIFDLIMNTVYIVKGINPDSLSDEEYYEFIKSAMPEEYENIKEETRQIKEKLEQTAKEMGVKTVSKEEFEKHPEKYEGMYGISLKDILEGKESKKINKH